jgi:colanic acid/amylovoran biosynthesis protein
MTEGRMKKVELVDRQVTVGLLGASFETNNLGVAALACGAVASVSHSNPNARIFLCDYAKEPATYEVVHPGGIATVELINIRFSKRFYLQNNIARLLVTVVCLRLLPSRKWRTRLLLRNHVLKAIWSADLIGSIAGGDSFSDIYGLGRLIYVTLPQILVILLGKPLVLLPQTHGPFKGSLAKAVARYIIRRSQIVYSRDSDSLLVVREILNGDNGRLEFCYDMAFGLEPQIRNERIPPCLKQLDRGIPLVGLNVSGLLYIGGYTRNNMFGLKADYRRLIHDLIDYFVRIRNAHVILVPHVLGSDEKSESDVIACREIYRETEQGLRANLHLIEEDYDQHELKALIGRCDFFLGSRMHACIAALSQSVPAVGLSYSRKFRGVFESVGMKELAIDLREHDENSIVPLVDRIYERRPELRAQLEAKMPTVRASVLELFRRHSIEPDQTIRSNG